MSTEQGWRREREESNGNGDRWFTRTVNLGSLILSMMVVIGSAFATVLTFTIAAERRASALESRVDVLVVRLDSVAASNVQQDALIAQYGAEERRAAAELLSIAEATRQRLVAIETELRFHNSHQPAQR